MSRLRAHTLLAFLVHAGCGSCGPRAQKPAPAPSVPAPPPPRRDLVSRLARGALAIRHTAVGNALYRYAPAPVLNALKARLK